MRSAVRVTSAALMLALVGCLVLPAAVHAEAEPVALAVEDSRGAAGAGESTEPEMAGSSNGAGATSDVGGALSGEKELAVDDDGSALDAAAPEADSSAAAANNVGSAAPADGPAQSTSASAPVEAASVPTVRYRAHVANIGWLNQVENGADAGTAGSAAAMEALEVELAGLDVAGSVELRGHVADIGWQDWQQGIAGTTGRALSLQAVQIRLTGAAASRYSVYYRACVQGKGWLGWAKDGESAGTQGYALPLEAVQIMLVPVGASGPAQAGPAFEAPNTYVSVTAHTSAGWTSPSDENAPAGTAGGNSIDGLTFALKHIADVPGGISYQTHTALSTWPQKWADGATSAVAEDLPLEGLRLRLTGALAETTDVWYRVYSAGIGWLGWASNGADAGTEGLAAPITAVEVRLLKRGSAAPGTTEGAYRSSATPNLVAQAHVSDIGWMEPVAEGTVGTTGKAKAMEALRIGVPGLALTVRARAHVANIGWQAWQTCTSGTVVGTTGRALALQAVQFELTGAEAARYHLYYRAHVSDIGWMGWAHDGEAAGTTGYGRSIEAIEFKLLPEGATPPTSDGPASIEKPTVSIEAHVSNKGWLAAVGSGGTVGDPEIINNLEAFRATFTASVSGGFTSSAYVQGSGWTSDAANGAITGTVGKARALGAVRLALTGEAAEQFDVWYRVYLTDIGWLGWASNGNPAGATTGGFAAKGMQVKVLPKGSAAPGSTGGAYYDASNPLRYYANYLPGGAPTWVGARYFSRGREGNTWDYIVIHISECPTLSAIDNTFHGTRRASAHLGVGAGEIHQYVSLADTAWAVGNWPWNTRSVSIEHVGTTRNPPSRAVLDTSAQLMCALAKQKGWTQLVLGQNVGIHKWYVATSCPATLDVTYLVSRANQLLNGRFECPTVPNGPAVPKDRSTVGMLSLSETLADTSCLACAGKGI